MFPRLRSRLGNGRQAL